MRQYRVLICTKANLEQNLLGGENVNRTRVVVTGIGIISPIGNDVNEVWASLSTGKSGIDTITLIDTSNLANHIAGEVKNFDPAVAFDQMGLRGNKEIRRTDRITHLAVAASKQALEDSGLQITEENRWDIGCIVGSGIGGIHSLGETWETLTTKGHKSVSPFSIPKSLIDSASGNVSMYFGLNGPNFCITTACATGNNAIGEATAIIQRGQAKVMLASASEAAIVPMTLAGFNNMTALSNRNESPQTASRPFDKTRDGFVPGEGAATLVLEDLDFALARGAKIYAEVVGYGHTSDAHHPTAPMETGEGAAMAMKKALRDAGLEAKDIDYINAHGTSTPLNDTAETNAMKRAFGEEAYNIHISSTKSMTGHLLGAAGAVEAVFSILAMQNNFIPPTINLHEPDPSCDLNYTPNVGVAHEVKTVMSNAFGFGGHNAVIIMSRFSQNGA
jgi:3-oxoacyl-[acyl-carrier-protein] synthase II